MFKFLVSCSGISSAVAKAAVPSILEEFAHRPWHRDVTCSFDGQQLVLAATNDYDANGSALLDEFSDAVFACVPIEEATVSLRVDQVVSQQERGGGV